MSEVIALVIGATLGVFAMALLSADAYRRGSDDEREKLWRATRRRDR